MVSMRDGSVETTARPEHENQTMRSWLTDWTTGCGAFAGFAMAVPDQLVED